MESDASNPIPETGMLTMAIGFKEEADSYVPMAWVFDVDDLEDLARLARTEWGGGKIRVYSCINNDPTPTSKNGLKLITVAVPAHENPDGSITEHDITSVFVNIAMNEFSNPCPPSCSSPSPILKPERCAEVHLF